MTKVFVIFDPFLPIFPLNNLKNQNFEKMKKTTPGEITILNMCTIHENHMMYGSWDMECNRQNFLSFKTIFCPFNPNNNTKKRNFEKMKKCLDICHVTQMYQKSWPNDHILNCSWDTRHDRCNFYFSFWDIFISALFPPNNPKK